MAPAAACLSAPQMVEVAVLGADEELGDAVAVEVDDRRARRVLGDVPARQRAAALEDHPAVLARRAVQQIDVGAVDEHVEVTVPVPVHDAELAPTAAARAPAVEPQRLPRRVDEDTPRRRQLETPAPATSPVERQVPLVVEHDEIDQPVAVEVGGDRRRAPLRHQLGAPRTPPEPCRLRGRPLPGDLDTARRSQARLSLLAVVAIPEDLAPDRVDEDVATTVAVPVGDRQRRVAPLRLAGPLDGAVVSRLDADRLAARLQVARRGPARRIGAVEVLDEADVAGRVAADDVVVTVLVPPPGGRRAAARRRPLPGPDGHGSPAARRVRPPARRRGRRRRHRPSRPRPARSSAGPS